MADNSVGEKMIQFGLKEILIVSLLASIAVVTVFILRMPSATQPESVLKTIQDEVVLLERVNRGDLKAALELSEAYGFIDSNRQRSIDVLRKVLSSGDVSIEAQLGRLLINEVLGQAKSRKSVDEKMLDEAIVMLRSAKNKGSAQASLDLETATQILGDSRLRQ
jgi:hypothetical protein